MVEGYAKGRRRWFRHFSALLKAAPTCLGQLAALAWATDHQAFIELAGAGGFEARVASPTSEVYIRHASRKTDKAAGTDGLVGEVFRACAEHSCRAFVPVLALAAWTLVLPFQSRGGQLVELWKQKGSAAQCCNSRDVHVKDLICKDLSAHWRKQFVGVMEPFTGQHAFGGLHGRGTDLMSLVSRSHWSYLHFAHLSGSQLFIDLSAAFAPLMRQIAYCRDRSDEAIASLMALFNLPASAMSEFRDIIRSPDAFDMAACGAHLRECVRLAHSHSWFVVNGVPPMCCLRGWLPGW